MSNMHICRKSPSHRSFSKVTGQVPRRDSFVPSFAKLKLAKIGRFSEVIFEVIRVTPCRGLCGKIIYRVWTFPTLTGESCAATVSEE